VPLLQGQVLPALLHELQVLPALFHQRQASPTLLYFQGCLLLAGGSPFARLNFHSRLEAQANVGQFSWQAGPAHWARALPTLHDPGLRARLAEIVAAACKTSRQPAVIDMQIRWVGVPAALAAAAALLQGRALVQAVPCSAHHSNTTGFTSTSAQMLQSQFIPAAAPAGEGAGRRAGMGRAPASTDGGCLGSTHGQ
jgi:hypothetical protein